MVQDVYSKADVLNTTGTYGAPNFRQVKESYPLYGMGQPSLNGFKQVLQRLQAQGHQVIVFCFLAECFSGGEALAFSRVAACVALPGLFLSMLSVNI